uniref:Putative secreted protein n=1 Tax=Ixodes ricinus TaxID=34613 RepID=A0A6B0U7P9_IXORI
MFFLFLFFFYWDIIISKKLSSLCSIIHVVPPVSSSVNETVCFRFSIGKAHSSLPLFSRHLLTTFAYTKSHLSCIVLNSFTHL